MNVDEIQTIKDAITVCDRHGYHVAAEALREVAILEFAAIADRLAEELPPFDDNGEES